MVLRSSRKESHGGTSPALRMMTVLLVLSALTMVGIRWHSSVTETETYEKHLASSEIRRTSSAILYMNEALTSAAAMEALTHDKVWRQRYLETRRELSERFIALKRLLPGVLGDMAGDIEGTSDRLADIESSAFMLIDQNYPKEASDLIASAEYSSHKTHLGESLEKLDLEIGKTLRAQNEAILQANHMRNLILGGVMIAMFLLWALNLRLMIREQNARRMAEDASQVKSDFLANMSHELRTPMHGIIGFGEMLQQSKLDPDQAESVQTIVHSAKALLALLNDILDFSRIQAGQFSLEKLGFDLYQMTHETLALARGAAKGRKVEVRLEYNAEKAVMGDPLRLRQILLNLIGNAIKFTPQDGHVTVKVTDKAVGHDSRLLRFEVTDTGIGIPAEKHESIFQKFTQADTSTTRTYGGSGLGLSICKHLVELMGGRIGLISAPGKGSTFWFEVSLPLAKDVELTNVDVVEKTHAVSPEARRLAYSVLVVDDNGVNLLLAKRLLQRMGIHNVQTVRNGREALERLESGSIDLVLMDCQMPELDGYAATQEWRLREERFKRKRIPIIALTANALPSAREECLASGMDEMLIKPFDERAIHQLVAKVLGLNEQS